MFLSFFLSFLLSMAPVENTASLTIKLDDLNSNKGFIIGQLFEEKNHLKYPCNQEEKANLEQGETEIVFSNLLPGNYSVFVYHDENKNNNCDENFLGIPKELVGFSNNPKIRFSAPSFEAMKVSIAANEVITIKMLDF